MASHKLPPVFRRDLLHKTPPSFNRSKFSIPSAFSFQKHKLPPEFKRPKVAHKSPPPFRRIPPNEYSLFVENTDPSDSSKLAENTRDNSGNALIHKMPRPFIRAASPTPPIVIKQDDVDKKTQTSSSKKPPIFSKSPPYKTDSMQSRRRPENSISFGSIVESELESDDGFSKASIRNSPDATERTLGEFPKPLNSAVMSEHSLADSLKSHEGRKMLHEARESIESAMMHLQPEMIAFNSGSMPEYGSNSFGSSSDENKSSSSSSYGSKPLESSNDYLSSDYSSGGIPPAIFPPPPRPSYIFQALQLQAAKPIIHKQPPPFHRNDKSPPHLLLSDKSETVSLISSSLSVSPKSVVPTLSVEPTVNTPHKSSLHLEEEKIVFDSPSVFISGISDSSPDTLLKKTLHSKSSAIQDSFILDKSKTHSPFISNNFLDRSIGIPMRNINYFERPLEEKEVKFESEKNLPIPLPLQSVEFSYPSLKKNTRSYNSAVTIFTDEAELPFGIKNTAALIRLVRHEEKPSKYKLKKAVTIKELEKMARILANDLVKDKIF